MFHLPSPIQKLNSALFTEKQLDVYVKRDDLIHPIISGNKWRKLKLNIERFKEGKYEGILTFGGAYSNHIAATAEACDLLQIPVIGIIRGDELNSESNNTLKGAKKAGMDLVFTSREEYALRNEVYYQQELRRRHGNVLIIEEGGANYYGMLGCTEIIKETELVPDYWITASGTGTTAAGLLLGSSSSKIVSIPVLKQGEFIREEIKFLLQTAGLGKLEIEEELSRLILKTDYHFGGYGKFSKNLLSFIDNVQMEFDLPLDQIYTAKMFFGFLDLVKKDEFEPGSAILILHTGGLQGLQGIK